MPRRARAVLPGVALHIVQRGINRNPCFLQAGDFAAYLGFLAQFSAKFNCAVHAYCLMTNHVHRLGRSGTLWEGRFHSCLVNSDTYVLACYRYIELNPVRAGMVAAPGQYPWSSYSSNADGVPSDLVAAHAAYDALATHPDSRARSYKELCLDAPSPLILEEIRKATRIGCVVGKRRKTRGRPAAAR
jgi:putative transposase